MLPADYCNWVSPKVASTPNSTPHMMMEIICHMMTVRNYLSSAMSKIGVSSRHAAAEHAWQQGWI